GYVHSFPTRRSSDLDQDGIADVGAGQADDAAALGVGEAREHRPAMGRDIRAGGRGTRHRKFHLTMEDVWQIELRIALPVQCRLRSEEHTSALPSLTH